MYIHSLMCIVFCTAVYHAASNTARRAVQSLVYRSMCKSSHLLTPASHSGPPPAPSPWLTLNHWLSLPWEPEEQMESEARLAGSGPPPSPEPSCPCAEVTQVPAFSAVLAEAVGGKGSLGGIRGIEPKAENSLLPGDLNSMGKAKVVGRWGWGLQGSGSLS